jgi:hypothetical protein
VQRDAHLPLERLFFERVSSLPLLHSSVLQHEDPECCWSQS